MTIPISKAEYVFEPINDDDRKLIQRHARQLNKNVSGEHSIETLKNVREVIGQDKMLQEMAKIMVWAYPEQLEKLRQYLYEAEVNKAELLAVCAGGSNVDYHEKRLLELSGN
jgi:hypothetical protein